MLAPLGNANHLEPRMTRIEARRQRRENRREIRQERRKLRSEHRAYIDEITAGIWSENPDIGEARRVTEAKVNNDAAEMGFDPATILLLVQLALLIYKALKHLGFFKATPEQVSALFEDDDE